jgi:hypothetical protein
MGYIYEDLSRCAKVSKTITNVTLLLGASKTSNAYVGRLLKRHKIDTSHFLGCGYNKGLNHKGGTERVPPDKRLVLRDPSEPRQQAHRLRRCLIDIGREYKCELCGQGPIWNKKPLVLHVDHRNGLLYDDRSENLRFLCPHCHTQQPTSKPWRHRNKNSGV